MKYKTPPAKIFDLLFLGTMFIFSVWLMYHTFSYVNGQFQIASKVYSDFGSHVPLLRSFSKGDNWPPQYPLYPGETIKYHFLFYFFSGLMEKLGVRIDHSLNMPSAMGLFLLITCLYLYGKKLFSSKIIGFLSVIFFLFNGSFSFLDFFASHDFNLNAISEITENVNFSSFGPWNGSVISAFWNLNIYTNQRHLGMSFAICLLLVILLFIKKDRFQNSIGFLLGSLLLVNQAAFIIASVYFLYSLVTQPLTKKYLLSITAGISPWIVLYLALQNPSPNISFHLGYLLPEGSTLFDFLKYWFYNLGLHSLLIPVGFLLSPKKFKLLGIPTLMLFVIPNIFKLSPDIINNHKLFNFFLIAAIPFSSFAILKMWQLNQVTKTMVTVLSPFLILGGIFDYFPIHNDYYVYVDDFPIDKNIAYFIDKTPPNSVVLNDTWFYNPASLAGRAVFNGYPYFTWSYGYDQVKREQISSKIYSSVSKVSACNELIKNNIDYVEISRHPEKHLLPEYGMWNSQFIPDYVNSSEGLITYSVQNNCQTL